MQELWQEGRRRRLSFGLELDGIELGWRMELKLVILESDSRSIVMS